MNENYWLIRAEPVAADEVAPLPPGHRLIHVYHISSPKPDAAAAAAAANNNGAAAADGTAAAPATPANSGGGGFVSGSGAAGSVTNFGDPFLLRIAPDETLGQVRACRVVILDVTLDVTLVVTYSICTQVLLSAPCSLSWYGADAFHADDRACCSDVLKLCWLELSRATGWKDAKM
jgi:hypothetical protein